jgi:hypothetical protein
MSYTVNKTDGTVLTIVGDGTVDNTSTDISLVGRKFSGYGEILNENFVKLLESFANNTSPDNPIAGQIWYDTLEGRLKVYTGTQFKPTGGPLVQDTQPAGLVKGDLWVDSLKNQIYFFDGIDLTLAGPIYSKQQDINGWVVDTIVDTNSNGRVVSKLYVNGLLVAILSKVAFTPRDALTGFATINIGLNFSTNVSGLKLHGSATSADTIAGIDPGNFLRADIASSANAPLSIQDDLGLTIGEDSDISMVVQGNDTIFKNNLQNRDFRLQVNKDGSGIVDAINIDTSALQFTIWPNLINSNLTVGGNAVVTGNLTVNGTTTYIDTQNLRTKDKNIELSYGDTPTDLLANGGGITLKGDTDHTINWSNADDAWESSESISIATGKEFRVNEVNVLNETTLGSTVVNSSLETLGTLREIQIDDIYINDGVISTNVSNVDITLDPNGTGAVRLSNSQLKDVANPTDANDGANKYYVDYKVNSKTLALTMNISGMIDPEGTDIPLWLSKIAPVGNYEVGTEARVLCETLSLGGGATSITVKRTGPYQTNDVQVVDVNVDKGGILNSASTVQDFSFPFGITLSGSSIGVNRVAKLFRIVGSNWTYIQDI